MAIKPSDLFRLRALRNQAERLAQLVSFREVREDDEDVRWAAADAVRDLVRPSVLRFREQLEECLATAPYLDRLSDCAPYLDNGAQCFTFLSKLPARELALRQFPPWARQVLEREERARAELRARKRAAEPDGVAARIDRKFEEMAANKARIASARAFKRGMAEVAYQMSRPGGAWATAWTMTYDEGEFVERAVKRQGLEEGQAWNGCRKYRHLSNYEAYEELVLDEFRAEWLSCRRRLIRRRREAAGLPPLPKGRCADGDDFAFDLYIERGKQGRLHAHAIVIFGTLPDDVLAQAAAQRPAPGKRVKLSTLEHFWTLGQCEVTPIRFRPGDNWGQVGLAWETVVKTPVPGGSPVLAAAAITGSAAASVGYVANYAGKAAETPVKGRRRHMSSRGFGLGIARRRLRDLARTPAGVALLRPLSCQSDLPDVERLYQDARVSPGDLARYAAGLRLERCYRAHPRWVSRLIASYEAPSMGDVVRDGVEAADELEDDEADVGVMRQAQSRAVFGELRKGLRSGGTLRRRVAAAEWYLQAMPAVYVPESIEGPMWDDRLMRGRGRGASADEVEWDAPVFVEPGPLDVVALESGLHRLARFMTGEADLIPGIRRYYGREEALCLA